MPGQPTPNAQSTPDDAVAARELRIRQIVWATRFNGYEQLAGPDGGPVELAAILDPATSHWRRTGSVPPDCPLDVLRGWAFFLVRADRHGGGYSLEPGGSAEAEFTAVLEAIAQHPGAQGVVDPPPGIGHGPAAATPA